MAPGRRPWPRSAGLAFLASSILADDDELAAIVDPAPQERRIDLIAPVIAPLPSDDFEIDDDGLTVGYLDLLLPGERTMRVAPGTPGEITCEEFEEFYACGVFADVLGDAVVWFALVPADRRTPRPNCRRSSTSTRGTPCSRTAGASPTRR